MRSFADILNDLFSFEKLSLKSLRGKQLILCAILLPFLFFYLQQLHPFVKLRSLKGYFIPKVYTQATIEGWFSGDYQRTTDDYVNENFGFRSVFVRINNQIRFLLFNKAQAEGVIVGKENNLYEVGYIDTYFGGFFLGEKAINDTIQNIKFLQDTLKSMGKELLIVLAPSKARVYPEYIPDRFVPDEKQKTNYDYYYEGFKKAGVQFIDFNSLYLQKKNTVKYPLFPKLGVHWSRYEAVLAADSIIQYLSIVSNGNLPRLRMKEVRELDTLQAPDNDIVDGMNLLVWPKHPKMSYPTSVELDKNKSNRNLIVVADSYWWDIFLRNIPQKVFENNEFWYYNNEIWGSNFMGKTDPKKVDIKRHILRSDYIVLMCTESNLSRIGFGFIGNAVKAIRVPIEPTPYEINDIKEVIKNSSEWYAQVQAKSQQRNLSLDSMMTLDAHWYFQKKGPIKLALSVADVKISIQTNESWMKEITAKAKDRNISVDSMMTEDALWYMKTVLHISDPSPQKETMTINSVKDQIRRNPEWMHQIELKSQTQHLPADSMMTLDAIWYIEQHKKK